MSSEEPSTANHSPTKPALLHNGILLGSNRISGAPLPNIFLLGMEGDILVPLLQLIEVNNLPHPDRPSSRDERNGFMGGNPFDF